MIHDLKQRRQLPSRSQLSFHGRTGKLYEKLAPKATRKTRRNGFHPRLPGELVEIDTVDIFVDGLKRYLITAIDLPTRFAFAYIYKSGSSASARDFLTRLNWVTPQSNGHLERFNRTIQEQFTNYHSDYIDEPDDFNRLLMDYLIWYNTEKVHRGIGKTTPLRYYLDNFVTNPEKSNMYWTLTFYCVKLELYL
jgi:transposase InsO family protein